MADGQATIHLSESLKQSANYQSADISVGVSLTCGGSDKDIKAAFARAEGLIEPYLVKKFKQQRQVLKGMTTRD